MTRTRHIAGVLGLWSSTTTVSRLPSDVRELLQRAAIKASREQRAIGPAEDTAAAAQLVEHGMTIRDIDGLALSRAAEHLWETEARRLSVGPWLEAIRA
jgi:TRAP-type C4-dicarboxylate transport system substrate-binding protein